MTAALIHRLSMDNKLRTSLAACMAADIQCQLLPIRSSSSQVVFHSAFLLAFVPLSRPALPRGLAASMILHVTCSQIAGWQGFSRP